MPDETNVDDKGKMEIQLRILGNELVAIKMSVDDFKMKWLFLGVVAIWCLQGLILSYFNTILFVCQA